MGDRVIHLLQLFLHMVVEVDHVITLILQRVHYLVQELGYNLRILLPGLLVLKDEINIFLQIKSLNVVLQVFDLVRL